MKKLFLILTLTVAILSGCGSETSDTKTGGGRVDQEITVNYIFQVMMVCNTFTNDQLDYHLCPKVFVLSALMLQR